MNPFNGMGGLTKNPLGILAIFLGVLYGIAGLLLGTSQASLTDFNETLLTLLVVIFPFVSLGAFCWLVAKHHAKLYSPTDYRSDEGFMNSIQPATLEETARKLDYEADMLGEGDVAQLPPAKRDSDSDSPKEEVAQNTGQSSDQRRELVRRVEKGVFELISGEFEEIRREVKIVSMAERPVVIDGVGYSKDREDGDIIEVVLVRRSIMISMRARDLAFQVSRLNASFPHDSDHKVYLCIAVTDEGIGDPQRAVRHLVTALEEIEVRNAIIRLFDARDLENLREYAL